MSAEADPELRDWVEQQVELDEKLATEAATEVAKPPWYWSSVPPASSDTGFRTCLAGGHIAQLGQRSVIFVLSAHDLDYRAANLIEAFDPGRVLADAAGRRELLAAYDATVTAIDAAKGTDLAAAAKVRLGAYLTALRASAMAYRGREGYREEWALQ